MQVWIGYSRNKTYNAKGEQAEGDSADKVCVVSPLQTVVVLLPGSLGNGQVIEGHALEIARSVVLPR
jgi:hypothetical protein